MSFLYPQALVLLVPIGFALWRWGRVPGSASWLRIALVAVLVLALTEPEIVLREGGSDVILVADRSRSMPAGSEASLEEMIKLVQAQRRKGDRLGVISFGREARVDLAPSHNASFGGFTSPIDGEASNLALALDAAFETIPPERAGRVLVVSDGRATGPDVRAAARRLAARGIPVDFRWLGRDDQGLDVAVSALETPPSVAVGEPFQLTATLHASLPTSATLQLSRDGKVLVKGKRDLLAGDNLITLRDLIDQPGLASYKLEVAADGDTVSQNDVGRAVTRIEGPPKVLVLTDKADGALVRTLRDAKLDVAVRAPGPLDMAALDNVGSVVLEDVEAGRLSESGLGVLAQYVKEAGGGLVMTGGRHSFGEGGYRKSPIEDVLPVSLELREEQRKAAVAIAIVMDCSGSMGVTIPDGRTKMELAAEGVVGALQLLNDKDEASVFMVDTGPHEIFDMRPVSTGLPLDKVARGFSGGGGIYIGVGLRTARSEIEKSDKATRHALLFADASDSENPDDYKKTVAAMVAQGVTVSVIGMGTSKDSDAKLLEEIAHLGNGRMYFAADVRSLPRIFSQETIAVARSSFVDVATPLVVASDLALLGKIPVGAPPSIGGYNLTYLKGQASVGLRSDDDKRAPVLSFWPRGAGQVVAITAEIDGQYTGEFKSWPGARALVEAAVRRTLPAQIGATDAVARTRVQGDDLHVTLDFDPASAPAGNAELVILTGDAHARPIEIPMTREDDDRLGGHFRLPGSGEYHPVVKVGGRVFRAPAATLSYAPEFEPGSARQGKELLAGLAKASGGVERLALAGLFAEASGSRTGVALAPWLVAVALALLLAEVPTRRFWAGRAGRRRASPQVAMVNDSPPDADKSIPAAMSVPAPATPQEIGVGSALDQARERARKRLVR
jgi:Mg-chelatase subunit ChlD